MDQEEAQERGVDLREEAEAAEEQGHERADEERNLRAEAGPEHRVEADALVPDGVGDEVELVLPHALAYAGSAAQSTDMQAWIADLASSPEYWRSTHPQLTETLGILEFTLAEILGALYPEQAVHWEHFLD